MRSRAEAAATQRAGPSARQRPKTVAHALLVLAALAAWGFTVGLARAIAQLLDGDYAVAVVAGLPADPAWLFWLPEAPVLLTGGAITAAALAWRRASSPRLERVHYVVTSIGVVAFLAFLGTHPGTLGQPPK